jgi:hypothetical protein
MSFRCEIKRDATERAIVLWLTTDTVQAAVSALRLYYEVERVAVVGCEIKATTTWGGARA